MGKPKLKRCTCRSCGHQWTDFPGYLAKQSKYGCPACMNLYWDETDAGTP